MEGEALLIIVARLFLSFSSSSITKPLQISYPQFPVTFPLSGINISVSDAPAPEVRNRAFNNSTQPRRRDQVINLYKDFPLLQKEF